MRNASALPSSVEALQRDICALTEACEDLPRESHLRALCAITVLRLRMAIKVQLGLQGRPQAGDLNARAPVHNSGQQQALIS